MSVALLAQPPSPSPAQPSLPQVSKSALAMLAANAGRTLDGVVGGPAANGLTQLRLGGETLLVRLTPALPAGQPVQIIIQTTAQGLPVLTVQPQPAVPRMPAALPLPAAPQTLLPAATAPVPTAAAVPGQATQIAPQPQAPVAQVPSGGVVHARNPATGSPGPGAPMPNGTPAPAGPAASAVNSPGPGAGGTSVPTGPSAVAAPASPAVSNGAVQAAASTLAATPLVASTQPTTSQAVAQSPLPATQPPMPGTARTVLAAPRGSALPHPVASSTSGSAPAQRTAATPALNVTQPGQAAARQDSVLPLLQNLAALSARAVGLPAPVAAAATRLLAQRVALDRGAPGADVLQQAVSRAGVLSLPATSRASVDVKSALLQLRAGLLTMLGDGDIAPVAPVARRASPPMRNAQPRGVRSDAPSLPDTATPRDTARTLLHQTDSALSRLKLTQLASQPADARAGAPAMLDLTVEIPMMLGHELALAQLQIQRDGKAKDRSGERGWRLRFAVNFSMVGEVGAQVSLLAQTTSVVLWAAEEATATALEDTLPELGAALAARGLEVGSLRLRRGVPKDVAPASGQLMDAVR